MTAGPPVRRPSAPMPRTLPKIGPVTTTPDTSTEQVLHLLELLASGSTVAEIAGADAPSVGRDLALRIAHTRDVHQRREAGLAALLDTARELATEHDPAQVLEAIVRRARHL